MILYSSNCKFHAFWKAHFDRNTAVRGTNSDCGGLIIWTKAVNFAWIVTFETTLTLLGVSIYQCYLSYLNRLSLVTCVALLADYHVYLQTD